MKSKINIYQDIDIALRKRWLGLWEESDDAHPFNHPEWFKVAPLNCKDSDRIIIVFSKGNRDLLFIAGESINRKLSLLGSPYMEKSSILISPSMSKNDFRKLIKSLLDKYDQITFQEIPLYLSNILNNDINESWAITRRSSFSPYFKIKKPSISGDKRRRLSRYTRKLDRECGPLSIDFIPLTVPMLHTMKDIEKRSIKPFKRRAVLDKDNYYEFLKSAIANYKDMCWVGLMHLAGNPVAHLTCIIYRKSIFALHTAFDKRFSRYSVGSVLIFKLIPIFNDMNIELFEFGRGQSVIKSRFSDSNINQHSTAYFFSKNFSGMVGMLKTVILWKGIYLGRMIRKKKIKEVNYILDRLSAKR